MTKKCFYLDAVLTVSPNKQYRGIVNPTTPAQQGPLKNEKLMLRCRHNKVRRKILMINEPV